ncbi:MAG: acetate--CoA ligase family protein [Proteobacteria bacterium]|jgi:hypothetical protein|nr:acetate--CoA ligase family protein [Pseudomonadota bacterium]
MLSDSPIVFAVAPDKPTAAFARRAFSRAGIGAAAFVQGESQAAALTRKIRDAGDRAVIAVLDSRSPRASLDAIAACGASGGLALCLAEPQGPSTADRDGWLFGQIWSQRGGLCCPDIGTMIEAIRLHAFLGPSATTSVRTAPSRSAVAARLGALAARLGVLSAARDKSAAPTLEIAASGEVSLCASGSRLALPDPESSLRALGLLASGARKSGAEPSPPVDRDVVDLIVRPPARTLSEVASKRLVEAYGIALPKERLCASPTESTRYAAELGTPAVLKLVRPGTPNKALSGAVRLGVSGAAHVRRAHHELVRRGKALGPPAPLGVLVCPEIGGGARIWIARERHPVLGLLVAGGAGDRPTEPAGFALAAPATIVECRRALAGAGLAAQPAQLDALAEATSRLSRLVGDLGDRIDLAEIHPLVAPEDGPALALDALIAVSD